MRNYLLVGLMILSLPFSAKAIEAENPVKPHHLIQLMWGKNQAEIPGLKCVDNQSNKKSDFFKEYIIPNDPLEVEGIKVKQIRYTFWRDKLCSVTILTNGQKNYFSLKNKASALMNRPDRKKAINSQSVWFGSKTVAKTEYDKRINKGQLHLKSNDIQRQIQLVKFTPTNVYSTWIKYKRGISPQ